MQTHDDAFEACGHDAETLGADGPIDEVDGEECLVRAFTLTGGRTRSTQVAVPTHSVVAPASTANATGWSRLGPIETEIWQVTAERLSSAEISSRLQLPLGVVRVLVGDLASAGLVTVGRTTAVGNAHILRRLIDGVHAV